MKLPKVITMEKPQEHDWQKDPVRLDPLGYSIGFQFCPQFMVPEQDYPVTVRSHMPIIEGLQDSTHLKMGKLRKRGTDGHVLLTVAGELFVMDLTMAST